jgi:hypothetical protein
MEKQMEENKPIEIDLRKYNKISFDLILEESNSEDLGACKFVIEDKEMSFLFEAKYDQETNSFNIMIPPLKNNLQESKLYKSKLQVTIDGQVYEPLETFVKGKESPKIKINNFQNESSKGNSEPIAAKPLIKATATNVKITSKEQTKEQLFESVKMLRNHVVDLEQEDPNSEELIEAKKELVTLFKKYKSLA